MGDGAERHLRVPARVPLAHCLGVPFIRGPLRDRVLGGAMASSGPTLDGRPARSLARLAMAGWDSIGKPSADSSDPDALRRVHNLFLPRIVRPGPSGCPNGFLDRPCSRFPDRAGTWF